MCRALYLNLEVDTELSTKPDAKIVEETGKAKYRLDLLREQCKDMRAAITRSTGDITDLRRAVTSKMQMLNNEYVRFQQISFQVEKERLDGQAKISKHKEALKDVQSEMSILAEKMDENADFFIENVSSSNDMKALESEIKFMLNVVRDLEAVQSEYFNEISDLEREMGIVCNI